MNRRFGVRGAALSRRSAGPDKGDGMIGLQACVITYWPDGPCWYCADEPPPDDGPPAPCDPRTAVEPCDGSGGTPPGGNDPCYDCEPDGEAPPPASEDDADKAPLDCTNPPNDRQRAFCKGYMDDARKKNINDALQKIAERGDECKKLAEAGLKLLTAEPSKIKLFDGDTYAFDDPTKKFGGAAELGGEWVVIDDAWTDKYETTLSSDGRNLQHTLVHELDHHLGRNHIGHGTDTEDKYNTPNSRSCAGL